ncbi:MAG: hypothetical protein NVS4B11_02330 [Ktedonobacteraceae bacterium]
MSDRIAHRPRYQSMRKRIQPSRLSQKDFLHDRWTYRRQNIHYEKHALGYGLSLVPLGYKFVRGLFIRYA